MKLFKRLSVLFYVTTIMFVGVFLLLYALDYISFESVAAMFYVIQADKQLKISLGSLAIVMLVINFVYYRLYSVNVRRDKTIAFDNPDGRVTISLLALEELIRRTLSSMSEIKDIKSSIIASKKGLDIKIRIVLRSEVNIPEVTSRIQESVKKKIHNAIGMDEAINVAIYVGKILPDHFGVKSKKISESTTKKSDSNIPFQGYRA